MPFALSLENSSALMLDGTCLMELAQIAALALTVHITLQLSYGNSTNKDHNLTARVI